MIVVPVCALVGIVFSRVQWFLVSRVKLTPERLVPSKDGGMKNGYSDNLIEEEESINQHTVVARCAEIQNAISEGKAFCSSLVQMVLSLFSVSYLLAFFFFFSVMFARVFLLPV